MASPDEAIVLQGSARKCTSMCADLFFPMINTEFGDKEFFLCLQKLTGIPEKKKQRKFTVHVEWPNLTA